MNSKYDGWEFLYEIPEEITERSRQYEKDRKEAEEKK